MKMYQFLKSKLVKTNQKSLYLNTVFLIIQAVIYS